MLSFVFFNDFSHLLNIFFRQIVKWTTTAIQMLAVTFCFFIKLNRLGLYFYSSIINITFSPQIQLNIFMTWPLSCILKIINTNVKIEFIVSA